MILRTVAFSLVVVVFPFPQLSRAEPLPFNHRIEVYREKDTGVVVFALRLEQPFLAEEFEKSNYLRLQSLDRNSYLIYPKETKFRQKHAEFYGRLRSDGKAKLRLSYEIVSENLDGSRKVDVRQADLEVTIPEQPVGSSGIFRQWAQQQNKHFANLLEYYPDQTFFEYVLLQSRERYGVNPPALSKSRPTRAKIEEDLFYTFSGGLAVQQSLQREILRGGVSVGDLNVHISQLQSPAFRSINYKALLEEQAEKGIKPQTHEITKLVPADQYFLHFNSMHAASELMDLSNDWGNSLLRLFTVNAREHNLREKFEDQLCIRRTDLEQLFAEGAISEMGITGSDMFFAEGADLSIIFRLKKADPFENRARAWLAAVKGKYPNLVEREFNYRGHKVKARYTGDRIVSSFVVNSGEYAIYSNSHRAIRKMVDALTDQAANLHEELDYRYATTLLPPSGDAKSAYLFASEAFLKRLVSPAFKISEKRRLQCFNNLVMLNNAALFYRLENGHSAGSLTDLIEGKFINPNKLVCPHGGAYAIDVERDTCTCSLHNRLKYLTPNVELNVLKVSSAEQQQYNRYKRRYESFWKSMFDPLAIRVTVDRTMKLEVCVLPFANSSIYRDLRNWLDETPQPIRTARIAPSAVASLVLVAGRERIRSFLRQIPGVPEVLAEDPTITDLSWIGDQLSLHFCDEDTILEIDPTLLKPLSLLGDVSVSQQSYVAAALAAAILPVYLTIDIEDEEKASRLLQNLTSRLFLKGDNLVGLRTTLDGYRLPDYKQHKVHVLSYQLYAIKVRIYVTLVDGRLVAATKERTLREVIDASTNTKEAERRTGHALLRLNRRALNQLHDDVQIYWAEKSRRACHRNIMSIYNLVKLYEVPVDRADKLADAKYGVTYFCPDSGRYQFDPKRDQVVCTVHGNRQDAQQNLGLDAQSSFAKFINGIDEIVATLKFEDTHLLAIVEIVRSSRQEGNGSASRAK